MQQLPQNVLVLVLGKVWQEERLTTCALVSKAWSEAAAVATDLVCLNYHGIPREGGWDPAVYMPYLQKHGQHVAALSCLDDWELDQKFVIELLPCSNLRELDLEDCAMQLGPSAEGSELQAAKPGLLQGLTALTKLVLTMQRVDDFVHPTAEGLACLTALTVLPALQHFDLSVGESYSAPDYVHGPYDIMPGSVFPGLTNLTLLELKSRLTVDSLEHISWLSKLQELVLHFRFPIPDFEIAAAAAQQPFKQLQQLTYLSLNIPEYQLVSSSSSPAFAGCTALQDLSLVKCCADASVLQGLTKLRSLNLAAFDVLTGGGAGWAAALGHLSCMQALEHLDVSQDVHEVGLAYNNPALGALSASPQLRSLWLSGVDLPPSGWSYLFPRSRVLTGLTTLQLRKMRPGTIMDTDHLRMLVGCCPALHELQVDAPQGFERGVSLLPLLQLPHLVDLTWGDVITRSAVSALSQLTRLERLSISVGPPDLDTCDILQLTALSNLRYLLVQEPGHEDPCCLQVGDGRMGELGRCVLWPAAFAGHMAHLRHWRSLFVEKGEWCLTVQDCSKAPVTDSV